jgi:hypothetical protein
MNKYIKVLSVMLVLSSSVFLSSANAANTVKNTSTTDMLINLAENDPVFVDRLNDIALTDEKLLNQVLKMAESDPVKLEKLLDLEERNPNMFWMIANIYNVQAPKTLEPAPAPGKGVMSTFGAISHGGVIRN